MKADRATEGFVDITIRKVQKHSPFIAFGEVEIREVHSEELILTATEVDIRVDPESLVMYVDLECLVNEDGTSWLRAGKPVCVPAVTRSFRWHVRSVNTV